ncbi:MAG: hypothetical protein GPJ54_13120 [Candidatus Heimdallarchaeota archaeon]|nr:hypothetical protein [Candidatus Heimdallarchaeota archaeon]
MKRQVFLILISIILLVNVPQISAAPGDSVAEAYTANLGEQQGTLDAYNDVEYYNFTGDKFQYYNFTLVEDPSNYNTIRVFDSKSNKIGENFTGVGPKSVILAGHVKYTIAIYASEFMELIPGNYSLIISETEIEVTPGPAISVETGIQVGTLELYNDTDWYNFSGSVSRQYKFEVTYTGNDSYTGLYIYDSDLHVIEWNWKLGSGNFIRLSGYDTYLIAVVSSEFVELPLDYFLSIHDDTIVIITSSTSETTSSTSSADQELSTSSTSSSTSSSSSSLPLQMYWGYFAIAIIPLVKHKLNLKK